MLYIQWSLPDLLANGTITGYTIQWGPKPVAAKPFIPENSQNFEYQYEGTITVRFCKNYFSDENGAVLGRR